MTVEAKAKRIRSLLFFWEAPDRAVQFRLGTEDRRIIEAPMAVLQGCAESPIDGIYQAWRLDQSNLTHDPKQGYLQVAFERDANPVELWHNSDKRWSKNEVSKLARENRERAKTQTFRRNNRDLVVYSIMLVILIIGLALGWVLLTGKVDWAGTWKMIQGMWPGGGK